MRLVAVSIVKNEADIIEAFVRHTRAWVDHHLIFDHDSTDGTLAILASLQREGLPLSLFRDDAPGYLQQTRSNHLSRLAAQQHAADWILPLDADEFIEAPDLASLEHALQTAGVDQPVSLPLCDYFPTNQDDPGQLNPVLRLRHRRHAPSATRKIFIPLPLALDPNLNAGKGSHALYRGSIAVPDRPLPVNFQLAHYALRSPEHQVLRTIRAELHRLSRGKAFAGLDVHYRLAYQILTADPQRFLATVNAAPNDLLPCPLAYRGTELRYTTHQDWTRIARSLLPYLEQLATSHGRLEDTTGIDPSATAGTAAPIHEIPPAFLPPPLGDLREDFSGFVPLDGWGPLEGPVPEACLPPFHWGFAPQTLLAVDSLGSVTAHLSAEIFTYADQQAITVEVNGLTAGVHRFGHNYQLEQLKLSFPLRPGRNELRLHYAQSFETSYDPRKLAVIFLRLQLSLVTSC